MISENNNLLTIMIAARNAEDTIERAVRSCIDEQARLLLVDDHSTDDTVARALRTAQNDIHVVQAPDPGGVPLARQTGLDTVQTPYAAWLDADDEWLPGRADRLLKALEQGYDVVTDTIDLHDGKTGRFLRRFEAPSFLRSEVIPVRLFERNYLPGDTQVAFRTDVLRTAGGYDPMVSGPESFDVLLRAISGGARFAYLIECGYRMYSYPGSVSRNLPRMRNAVALALRKHTYGRVRRLCLNAGYSPQVVAWVMVSMAMFRFDFAAALHFLEQASTLNDRLQVILEPDGPLPLPEGWRQAFFRGTLLLLLGGQGKAAATDLRSAEDILPTAEGANNLGVAQMCLGRISEATELFSTALDRFPGYLDAKLNLAAKVPNNITTHPIRRQSTRFEYTP